MASFSRYLLLSLLLLQSIILINHTAICEDDQEENNVPDEEDNLIQGINNYRASLKLITLTENEIAECLADEMADQLKAQPCIPANTVQGTNPQISNYPTLLARCGLNVSNILDGVILPTCVPNQATNLVLSSYTTSQNSLYLKDGKFSGIGIGSEDNWVVVVLITSTPGVGGSGGRGGGGGGGAGGAGGRGGSLVDGIDDDDEDEEDILHQGLNTFRTSLNLTALTENDKAECLADEIADQFKDQLCTTARSYVTPGSEPQFANYRRLLAKCEVNVATTTDGIILPACIPNLVPALVLSNYTQSRYSQYLKDTTFTGIGIGKEDNWVVIVLTTNTPGGSFIASQHVGNANLGAKLDPIYHLVFSIIGFVVILL